MRKQFLALVTVIGSAVVLAGCGAAQPQDSAKSDQAPAEEKMAKKADEGFSGSIQDLMKMNKAQKCTWQQEGVGMGTVYIDGEKSYVESTTKVEGKDKLGYVLSDGQMVYIWDGETKQGMKMDPKAMEEQANKNGANEADDVDEMAPESEKNDYGSVMAEDYSFACEEWRADSAKFVVPTDVTFQDFTKMMEDLQKSVGSMKGICDSLSGEDKTECLKGFEQMAQ